MYIKSITSMLFRLLALTGLVYNLWCISEIFFKFQITTEISIQIPRTYEPLDVHYCVRYTDLISSNIKVHILKNWNQLNETNQIRTLQHAISLKEIFRYSPNETSIFDHVEFREKGSYELILCNSNECNDFFNVTRFVFMEYLCYQISLRSEKISQSFDLINLAVSPAFSGLSVRMTLKDSFNSVHFYKIALSKPGDYPYTELAVAPQRFGDHNLMVGYKSLKSKLLPSPYSSDCLDYKTIGFNSRDDCYSKCVFEKTLTRTNKQPFAVILDNNVHDERIVSYIDIQDKNFSNAIQLIHEQCSAQCHKRDCYKESLTSIVMPLSASSKTFVIATVVPSDPEIDVKTNAKMSAIEFIIFVLSTISTWTSLSIMSLNPAALFGRGSLTRILSNFGSSFSVNHKNRNKDQDQQQREERSPVFLVGRHRQFKLPHWRYSRPVMVPVMQYRPPSNVHCAR